MITNKKKRIECLKLNSVLIKYNISSFEYLNIDVEGSELDVIKGIDFKKFTPILVTIENNDLFPEDYYNNEVYKILKNNDYIFINKIGVTNFFMFKKFANQISDFIKI